MTNKKNGYNPDVSYDDFYAVDKYTKVLLKFDDPSDPWKDECENTWLQTGNPTVTTPNTKFGYSYYTSSAVQNFISLDGGLTLGGQDFTIDFWVYLEYMASKYTYIFNISNMISIAGRTPPSDFLYIYFCEADNTPIYWSSATMDKSVLLNAWHHVGLVYLYKCLGTNNGICAIFLDGILWSIGEVPFARATYEDWSNPHEYTVIRLTNHHTNNTSYTYSGYLKYFRISDGICRWTENFEVPK